MKLYCAKKKVPLSIVPLDGRYHFEVIMEEYISANNWNVILEHCFIKTEDLTLPHSDSLQMSKDTHTETET